MDSGILTGIVTAAVLGAVFLLLYISSKSHKSKKNK
jgi:hypothetical protein